MKLQHFMSPGQGAGQTNGKIDVAIAGRRGAGQGRTLIICPSYV